LQTEIENAIQTPLPEAIAGNPLQEGETIPSEPPSSPKIVLMFDSEKLAEFPQFDPTTLFRPFDSVQEPEVRQSTRTKKRSSRLS
jgi:hypothetical protein